MDAPMHPQGGEEKRVYVTETEAFSENLEIVIRDLATDFVDNVCDLACKLAKHRKSDRLEEKDMILAISLLKPSSTVKNQYSNIPE
ncbi:unnamed protein product [Moneuplotes crassus]|uniref:Transcription initiation factor TFIID subunit 12 domain-containing protein n=1 Tax=Euplotes crassus TaxID=5936 RepID=A0AAD1Y2X6_EUPCR|nr:unnamed protein product [Moneuplotes crassus]